MPLELDAEIRAIIDERLAVGLSLDPDDIRDAIFAKHGVPPADAATIAGFRDKLRREVTEVICARADAGMTSTREDVIAAVVARHPPAPDEFSAACAVWLIGEIVDEAMSDQETDPLRFRRQ
jgi:hypothetical protein